MKMGNRALLLTRLKERELTGVTFIRDYVQFLFDGPILNVYSWPTIRTDGGTFNIQTEGYRDALCAQIDKRVSSTLDESHQRLVIVFADHSEIEISLKPDDRQNVEAAELFLKPGTEWMVW